MWCPCLLELELASAWCLCLLVFGVSVVVVVVTRHSSKGKVVVVHSSNLGVSRSRLSVCEAPSPAARATVELLVRKDLESALWNHRYGFDVRCRFLTCQSGGRGDKLNTNASRAVGTPPQTRASQTRASLLSLDNAALKTSSHERRCQAHNSNTNSNPNTKAALKSSQMSDAV